MWNKIDLAGKRFGRWLVLEQVRVKPGIAHWKCRCDCGTEKVVISQMLREGDSKSCGCLKKEVAGKACITHGLTGDVIYRLWHSMLRRCYDPKNKRFHRYGGRGIVVCEALRASVVNLLALLGHRPSARHSLGRMENDGNYSCGDCAQCLTNNWPMNLHWETSQQQARNRHSNHMITHNGETRCVMEWAELTGIKRETIAWRHKRGKDPFTPTKKPCP